MNRRRTLPQHAAAALIALMALPVAHQGLHIAADGFAFAWAAFFLAYAIQRRRPGLVWLTAAWLTLLAAVTDLPVLRDSITYLTGAAW